MKINAETVGLKNGRATVSLLVVDDEPASLELCRDIVSEMGLEVRTASSTDEAIKKLDQSLVDIIITDLQVPQIGGLELLKLIRVKHPGVAVMVLTQYASIENAVAATRLGALDYIAKPFHVEELRSKIERLTQSIELNHENSVLREQLRTRAGFGGLIGVSGAMQHVYRTIERVSQHKHPVLILGESGTGKELVARSIHFMGVRKNKPFVPVDCSTLVPTLIESELFGHVRGAFTGAQNSHTGLLEAGHGGTVFLDEIADLPVDMQAKLLRAVQESEIRAVGSRDRVHIDVRIIAATNRDLDSAIRNGSFRQDLFFRLNIVQIKLPPLRERKSDIPLLVTSFLEKLSDSDQTIRTISEDAMGRLIAYEWPGNVRELENAIERAVALGSGPTLHIADLPPNIQQGSSENSLDSNELTTLHEMERRCIFRALRETNGDKLAAARLLRIGKTTLYRKLKQYTSEPLNQQ